MHFYIQSNSNKACFPKIICIFAPSNAVLLSIRTFIYIYNIGKSNASMYLISRIFVVARCFVCLK